MNRENVTSLFLLLLPACLFFLPILVQGHTFAYRDSARFYHRQFEWNQAQWTNGQVPLWNPQENLGTPVVGEASSSVFYPFQLLFLFPFRFELLFVLYAALHVYLASVGSFFLSRALGCCHESAVFCGISYSLCGSVIFQTCNIVFLVGACWLPFCIWMSYLLYRVPRLSYAGLLGIFMSLTILGGDPQTAYHVGILSGLLITTSGWPRCGRPANRRFMKSVGCHVLAALIALGIAAIQIFPSWQATQNSTRSDFVNARSVWELGGPKLGSITQGIFGHPVTGTHHDHLYQFSQPPWTAMELVWPNVSGTIQPRHGRWSESIPAASRTWTPSIYCGLIAFVLFLSAMLRRHQRKFERWLKLGFVVFALGSLGWFGLGWLVHEVSHFFWKADPATSSIGAPIGGVYWFFVIFLPGYVNFRYPAKLFVVASLLLCLLASGELQRVIKRAQFNQVRRQFVGVVVTSTLVLVTLWLCSIPINRWFSDLHGSVATEFGPFHPVTAWSNILGALLHALVLGLIVIGLINQGFRPRLLARLLILLAVCDLTVANRSLILTARSEAWQGASPIARALQETEDTFVRIYRTDPMTWSAKSQWLDQFSPGRVEEIIEFENETLMPKNQLAASGRRSRIGLVESFRTIEDVRFSTLMAYLKNRNPISTGDSFNVTLAPDPVSLGVLSCQYLLVPSWGHPQIPAECIVAKFPSAQATLIRNPYCLERFRVSKMIKKIPEIRDFTAWLSEKENQEMVGEISIFGGRRQAAIVEIDGDSISLDSRASGNDLQESQVKVIRQTETMIELQVQSTGGLLVVADAYDEDWEAHSLDDQGLQTRLPVYRTNFVMRGIPLPRGSVTLRMTYRPRGLFWGRIISPLGLLLAAVCLCLGKKFQIREPVSGFKEV